MDGHISPGLASLVIQVKVFFTIFLSMARSGERMRGFQIAACLLAVAGIAVIAAHVNGRTTPLGLLLVVIAAACWASGTSSRVKDGRAIFRLTWFGAACFQRRRCSPCRCWRTARRQ
jgi:drug/metabolite transporter (DMT)-like permease